MECELCHRSASGLIHLRVYTRQGIQVCEECYKAVDINRHKPYSKIMDRVAIAEAGYYVNRKIAMLTKSSLQTRS
jgi:ribosome-binding protein aMBF1 (putative translation factor)